jgi:hypothetical protein
LCEKRLEPFRKFNPHTKAAMAQTTTMPILNSLLNFTKKEAVL